jgi:hypothetical protein
MTDPLRLPRREALLMIDMAAGQARQRYITEVAGQQAVYTVKLAEARAFLLEPSGVAGPHLTAEAMALGTSVSVLAAEVVAQGAHWLDVISPSIEAHRRGAKARVAAAGSAGDIEVCLAEALAALAAV